MSKGLDATSKLQLSLLLEAQQRSKPYADKLDQLITTMTPADDTNVSVFQNVLAVMLGVKDNRKAIAQELTKNVQDATVREVYQNAITKALTAKGINGKDDTNNIVRTIKKIKNNYLIQTRLQTFMDEFQAKVSDLNTKVVWQARANADGMCQAWDGVEMTYNEFLGRWPVHPNCMCTFVLAEDFNK